jgi:uncharacterized protein
MELTPTDLRILGALVEKHRTTPDAYPLTLNALTSACNQTSNRDPVMTLSEDAVRWAINGLRQQSLVRAIQPSESRVMKYQHLLAEKLELDAPELAVLCVLMLRGPQTPGEIKSRTGRLYEFAELTDVQATVSTLIARSLIAELPRRPGQKEARYGHLLAGPPSAPASDDRSEVAAVLADRLDAGATRDERIAALEANVDELRRDLAELRLRFER